MIALLQYGLVCIVLAVAMAYGLFRFRPRWPRWRGVALAAFAGPSLLFAYAGFVAASATIFAPPDCGMNECGMMISFAIFIAAAGVLAFLIGALAAATLAWLLPRT